MWMQEKVPPAGLVLRTADGLGSQAEPEFLLFV